jgi:hypothetical protein
VLLLAALTTTSVNCCTLLRCHPLQDLAHGIIPMINDKFEELDEDSLKYLQAFFDRFGEMVRHSLKHTCECAYNWCGNG